MLVLTISEGQAGRDRYRVPGVHSHGIDVLDRTDHHHVVVLVAHQLELVFLPADDGLLEQHLGCRAGLQAGAGNPFQIGLVIRNTRSGATHRERRANDDGITQFARCLDALLHRVADDGAGTRSANGLHDRSELLTVLAALDGVDVRTDQFHSIPFENTGRVQGDGGIQRGLTTEGGQQGVGALFRNDALDVFGRDGLDVGGVGELRVRHDRRGVGVDQDHTQTLVPKHSAGLRARVIEFARLPDNDRSRTDNHHGFNVGSAWHQAPPSRRRAMASAKRSNRYAAS